MEVYGTGIQMLTKITLPLGATVQRFQLCQSKIRNELSDVGESSVIGELV